LYHTLFFIYFFFCIKKELKGIVVICIIHFFFIYSFFFIKKELKGIIVICIIHICVCTWSQPDIGIRNPSRSKKVQLLSITLKVLHEINAP